MRRRPWWCRLFCFFGAHDWRHMDGVCLRCGWVDPLWFEVKPKGDPE